jgi:GNAT superfamily N-acetyltransferase
MRGPITSAATRPPGTRGRPESRHGCSPSAGTRAGYYELRPGGDGVELAYFGLLPAFQGRGLGGHLLTHALRRGLELAPRVWVHTETRDGPAALPNYLARGLRPYRREEVWQDLREGR